jgi:anti-anti-sigma regulatory factor
MLRITTHDKPKSLTFQLEGKLLGPWVHELEKCWRTAKADDRTRVIRFDLTDVTHIDAAGKEFLAARYGEGAELVAAGCFMKSIVAEVTRSPVLFRRLVEDET